MENTVENSENMESSALGDSNKGSRLEALQNGATGRDPAKQGAGETPLTGGGTPDSQQSKPRESGGCNGESEHSWPPCYQ